MPDLIWEIDDEDGVFLTFDDGPTPGVTEWILSTLDKYDAKATFFVLGKNVEMYPDLFQRILDAPLLFDFLGLNQQQSAALILDKLNAFIHRQN